MRFVFDIDGTLCFDRHTIAKEVKEVLEKASDYGHEVVFATARSYRDSMSVLGPSLAQNTVIGLNGGIVYKKGHLVAEKQIDGPQYELLLDWFEMYRLPFFVDNHFDYSGVMVETMPFYESVNPLKKARCLPLAELEGPVKLVVNMRGREEVLEDTRDYLSRIDGLDISYHAHEECLYINPEQTNKATTAVELYGKEFVAFGNDQNDIELFQASFYAVQVGDFPALIPYADDQVLLQGDYEAALAAKILQVFADFRGK